MRQVSIQRFNDEALAVFIFSASIMMLLGILDYAIGGAQWPDRFGAMHPLVLLAGQYTAITAGIFLISLAVRFFRSDEFWKIFVAVLEFPLTIGHRYVRMQRAKDDDELFDMGKLNDSPGGYVYLVKGTSGWYKIGHTVDPNDRMKTFSVKLPFDVDYVHIIKCTDRRAAEAQLHRTFAHRRGNGEWFSLSADDVATIKAIKEM